MGNDFTTQTQLLCFNIQGNHACHHCDPEFDSQNQLWFLLAYSQIHVHGFPPPSSITPHVNALIGKHHKAVQYGNHCKTEE
jgi:hypothetical protein